MASYKGTAGDGNRAAKLSRQREAQKLEFERRKKSIKEENSVGLRSMETSFKTRSTTAEDRFKASTVGLVSADDFKRKRELAELAVENEKRVRERALKRIKKKRKRAQKRALANLSFSVDDEEDASGDIGGFKASCGGGDMADSVDLGPKKRSKKCPDVDTSFLPDRDREAKAAALRSHLKKEWEAKQEVIKGETIEVTYSYWDGSGHRRTIHVKKGLTILKFLELCRRDLSSVFHELRGTSADNMMYIKEDVIIPHNYTFYDLIVSRARGKSGPLFHFDVHDDIRLIQDTRVEKDESHAGKIITRAYYERNRHVFPVNRWEVYDPNKKYEKYTIR